MCYASMAQGMIDGFRFGCPPCHGREAALSAGRWVESQGKSTGNFMRRCAGGADHASVAASGTEEKSVRNERIDQRHIRNGTAPLDYMSP